MADITTKYKSKFTGAEIDAKLEGQTNPNLLDNWYFGNPVNQRGITTSANNAYGIDRWLTFGGTHTVGDGYVEISQNGIMTQYMENPSRFNGKQLNFSVLIADGELFTGFATATNLGSIYFFQDPDMVAYRTSAGLIQFYPTTKAAKIIAVKLELGTQQTLAHQDASGNWVLNEIPDYNEQLLRCCMSTADSSDTYANNKLTAAAVNAVPLDGSKPVTGNLTISKSQANILVKDTNTARAARIIEYLNSQGGIENYKDGSNYRGIRINTEADDLAGALKLVQMLGGVWSEHNIFHTGNKPSGSYTGNGSAAARTIDTGGIGNVLVLWSNAGMDIITPGGALCKTGTTVSAISAAEVSFSSGVLKIASTNNFVNGSSVYYAYQVL